MASYQPAEPHWFLPLIGVDPICRGKGHGSALLAHMVARCDRDGQLAYLDSTNSRNVPLYERHGFERLGVIKVGSGPPVYPLLRRPRWGQLVGHDRDVDREARMPMVPIKLGRQLTLCAVLIGPVLAGRVASAERDRTAVRCEASGPRPRCVL
jgi:hypothetical protein